MNIIKNYLGGTDLFNNSTCSSISFSSAYFSNFTILSIFTLWNKNNLFCKSTVKVLISFKYFKYSLISSFNISDNCFVAIQILIWINNEFLYPEFFNANIVFFVISDT
mgnify:CR=1 FL=1